MKLGPRDLFLAAGAPSRMRLDENLDNLCVSPLARFMRGYAQLRLACRSAVG